MIDTLQRIFQSAGTFLARGTPPKNLAMLHPKMLCKLFKLLVMEKVKTVLKTKWHFWAQLRTEFHRLVMSLIVADLGTAAYGIPVDFTMAFRLANIHSQVSKYSLSVIKYSHSD
jgi:hypothetical protein